jgi:UDP-glucuronate decarboxylase
MKRALVAGGAGFIGSHLAETLVARGYQVDIVDDLSTGSLDNLALIRSEVRFFQDDVAGFRSNESFDVVFNFASNASRWSWEHHPIRVATANAMGSWNLLQLASKTRARYVFASSSEVYGTPDVVPTPESYPGKVSCTGTRSAYDEGKRFGEALAKAFEREAGLSVVILRLFNTYGPRMREGIYGRVIERFLTQAENNLPLSVFGDGRQTRCFTYVSDMIEGIVRASEAGTSGEVYNLGGDVEVRIVDLAKSILAATRKDLPIRFTPLPPDDPVRRAAETSKIRSLGWVPKISLDEGLRLMVASRTPRVRS